MAGNALPLLLLAGGAFLLLGRKKGGATGYAGPGAVPDPTIPPPDPDDECDPLGNVPAGYMCVDRDGRWVWEPLRPGTIDPTAPSERVTDGVEVGSSGTKYHWSAYSDPNYHGFWWKVIADVRTAPLPIPIEVALQKGHADTMGDVTVQINAVISEIEGWIAENHPSPGSEGDLGDNPAMTGFVLQDGVPEPVTGFFAWTLNYQVSGLYGDSTRRYPYVGGRLIGGPNAGKWIGNVYLVHDWDVAIFGLSDDELPRRLAALVDLPAHPVWAGSAVTKAGLEQSIIDFIAAQQPLSLDDILAGAE